MFEFAAAEFDSLMSGFRTYRKVAIDPMVAGGSLVLGVEQLKYTNGRLTVLFTSSAGSMELKIDGQVKDGPRQTLVNSRFTDFGAVREAINEHIYDS